MHRLVTGLLLEQKNNSKTVFFSLVARTGSSKTKNGSIKNLIRIRFFFPKEAYGIRRACLDVLIGELHYHSLDPEAERQEASRWPARTF